MAKPQAKQQKKVKGQASFGGSRQQHLPYLLIIVFAFVLYGNTLSFDYALDDIYAITGNSYTQKGLDGIPDLFSRHFFAGYLKDKEVMLEGGRYRPLSLVSFAVEYALFGRNPGAGHFFNILFYALTGILIFALMRKIARVQPPERSWAASLPFLASLLFLAHPVHTEVVANIKGRDEIYSLLGSLAALWYALLYLETRKKKNLAAVFFFYFLALLSKENAILWLVLVPLTLWFFSGARLRDHLAILSPMFLAAGLFLLIRFLVLDGFHGEAPPELLDNPFLHATTAQKFATILYTLGLYIKLLFFPHPLTWDYYPYHISLHNFSDRPVYTSILLYIVMVLIALWGLRNKKVYAWAVIFFLIGISLATNILFGIGTFMAERFLYLSSVSFAVLIAWLATTRLPVVFTSQRTGQQVANTLLVVILLLYAGKTISRNNAWRDDYTLYTTDVVTSSNSAKGNNIAGQWFAFRANRPEYATEKEAYFEKALAHIRKAVKIHPKYQDALFYLGNTYYDYKKDVDSTLWCYTQILKLDPEENNVFRNLTMVLGTIKDRDKAIQYWQNIYILNPTRFETNYHLAILYSDKDVNKAISHMLKAESKQPGNPDVLKFLGDGFYMKKEYDKTKYYWEKAIQNGATDPQISSNLKLLEPFIGNPGDKP